MIEGRKVRLRAWEREDARRGHQWRNDPEVMCFLAGRYPISLAEEERIIEGFATPSPDALRLAMETKDGVHIGSIGLGRIERENRTAELGIMIGEKDHWDKGYGTDAVCTLLDFAFNQMNLNRVWLRVHELNARAMACYRKCGFREEGRLRSHFYWEGRYCDEVVMGILRGEFVRPEAD